jgi:hypothetical protein
MNQVGQHLGATARHIRDPRTAAGILRALAHDGVRERDTATWAVASVLTLAWWAGLIWALRTGTSGAPATTAAVLAGGWSLSLLPVHCARRLRRPTRNPR